MTQTFGKRVFEKLESRFGDQVTYWEGTLKGITTLNPKKVSID